MFVIVPTCEDHPDAVVEAFGDGRLADDVVVQGAVGVGSGVQRPRHTQGYGAAGPL